MKKLSARTRKLQTNANFAASVFEKRKNGAHNILKVLARGTSVNSDEAYAYILGHESKLF